eukprot:822964-Pelagomonas_calceolata.AAC.3
MPQPWSRPRKAFSAHPRRPTQSLVLATTIRPTQLLVLATTIRPTQSSARHHHQPMSARPSPMVHFQGPARCCLMVLNIHLSAIPG